MQPHTTTNRIQKTLQNLPQALQKNVTLLLKIKLVRL